MTLVSLLWYTILLPNLAKNITNPFQSGCLEGFLLVPLRAKLYRGDGVGYGTLLQNGQLLFICHERLTFHSIR